MIVEHMDAAVLVEMLPIAAEKLERVRDKEVLAGVLLKHKETGQYRVMDAWGRFWTVHPPTDNGPS